MFFFLFICFAGSLKCHLFIRQISISFTQKILLESYLFQRISVAIFFLRKCVVGIHTYTSNFSLIRVKLSEKSYLIRFWKEKVPTFLCFLFLKEKEKYFQVFVIKTCNQSCFSILWHGDDERLHFLLPLITQRITGLRLMAWETLEHNFRLCLGLGNNLISFMFPFCELSEG